MPYVENNGIRIHYQVEGEGPALVLVHGTPQDLEDWREFGWVEELRNDYQLILVDIRGHGASDKPRDPKAYALELRVSDVVTVLNNLHINKAHYFGYSMGGWLGFGIAKYAPERFYSLIIGGYHPYGATASPEDLARDFGNSMDTYLANDVSPGLIMTEKHKARKLAYDLQALIASLQEDWPSLEDVLPTMTMPCLVYVGEADHHYPKVKKCVQQMPNVTFFSLPNLSHGQAFRYSHQVLPYVRKFLREVVSTPEQNKTLVRRAIKEFNKGNVAVIGETYGADWGCTSQPDMHGPEGVQQFLYQIRAGFSDAEAGIEVLSAEDDKVEIRWTFRGTHDGEWMGVPATGKRVSIAATTKDRIADGKIVETWLECDTVGMMQQFGVVSPEEKSRGQLGAEAG